MYFVQQNKPDLRTEYYVIGYSLVCLNLEIFILPDDGRETFRKPTLIPNAIFHLMFSGKCMFSKSVWV